MGKHVIVGAGPVGTETARLLVAAGEEVISVTRSGRGPAVAGVSRVAADASDADRLIEISTGADALYNCANPSHYGNWEEVWPPLWASMLATAEQTGALFVITSSLYGYGPVAGSMTEALPDLATEKNGRIRASMWAEAKALHDQGRIRAVEVRASDYAGAGVGANGHLSRNLPAALRGKAGMVIGNPDLPHSWTDVLDVARTLVAVADRPDSWGRVWIAPTNPPRSLRQAMTDLLELAGKPMVALRPYPKLIMKVGGWFNADLRELAAMSYIFNRSYVVDSTDAETKLGLAPTPWDEVCRRMLGSATEAPARG
ncbi:NAD-dependent epimerase/dehydratase family protein [Microlunatus soli]|uniref:Nucleoside-diphosphate-sugar epimerase n=1 Tax=Microlunatus soli TaxID=630515 RepID=A0A1H1PSW1_9ACTN|nr:NAD-dependent epimerase/dehydratase family protein [Microlunatus soli]SDS14097.1 Nucleoside-diphosphate-sugar epimerase [Microlunatus soli]